MHELAIGIAGLAFAFAWLDFGLVLFAIRLFTLGQKSRRFNVKRLGYLVILTSESLPGFAAGDLIGLREREAISLRAAIG